MVAGSGAWKKEHVLIIEREINRALKRGEVVHHINGKRNDNDLTNLFLCKDNSAHMRIHSSAMHVIYSLLETGEVRFNRQKAKYERVL